MNTSRHLLLVPLIGLAMSFFCPTAWAGKDCESAYVFSWPFINPSEMQPRGGTMRGPQPELVTGPGKAWNQLQEPGLSDFQRDRRAILAMAGAFRVSFDFLEIAGFTPDYSPPAPYRSWGTEYVYVIADEEDYISLQHVLVMIFEQEDGSMSEPLVTKHWRQDWRYEDREMYVYTGQSTWERRELDPEAPAGSWIQAVFQVDDSPRYQSVGVWKHHASHSSWQSAETMRPLPRREFSVRDDYQVLVGTNRHTIIPTGWIHEQDNLKGVLNDDGEPDELNPFLARELGVNRYERITGHDFSAGHAYWEATEAFWADVRAAWQEIFRSNNRFIVHVVRDDEPLYRRLFERAERIADEGEYDAETGRAFIAEVLGEHVKSVVRR